MRGCSARVWSRERLGRSKPARPAFPTAPPGYPAAVAAATGRWKNFLLGLDFRFLFAYPRRRGGTGLRRGRGTQGASRRRPAPRPVTFRRGAFPMAEAHSSLLAKTASANTDVRGTHPKAARDGEANPVPSRPKPWTVPARGLVVFHGPGKTARLSHYFLPRLLAVAVFSSIPSFTPSPARRRFFPQTCAAATEVWEFSLGPDNRLELSCSRAQPRLEGGNADLSKVR